MNKKNVDIVDALGECLEEIEAGRLTIEECLERYPDYAADLQELLATRQKLQKAPALQPAAAFRQQARTQLLSQLSTPTNKYPVFITVLVVDYNVVVLVSLHESYSEVPRGVGESQFIWARSIVD